MADDYRTRRPTTFAAREEAELARRQAIAEAAATEREERIERSRDAAMAAFDAQERRSAVWKAERRREAEAARARLEAEQADAREELLRARFNERFPGGGDQDFRLMRPQLLAELGAEQAASTAQLRGRRYSV